MAARPGTSSSFGSILNDYAPNEMFEQEFIKRDYLLTICEKDNGWVGGITSTADNAYGGRAAYIVDFEGTQASSISFNALTASNDIAEDRFVRGKVENAKEVWGTMKFNHRDLMEHGSMKKSMLKILPNRIDKFLAYIKEAVSQNLLYGPHFAKENDTGNSAFASGIVEVNKIDKFFIDQKVVLDDGTLTQSLYVIAIDVNKSTVTLSTSRGGSADDLTAGTAFTEDSGLNKFYHPNAKSYSFQSLIDALLSAANGGGASLHGQTKLSYPYLQAVNVSGSTINAVNILEKIFDAYNVVRMKARGNASTILMSYKHLGSVMKLIETQKGGFKVSVETPKASIYGWTEIDVTSVKGALKLVAVQEMPDEQIVFLDPKALVFASNGMFQKRKSPDGIEYFEERATTGYSYIVDICLFGELIVKAPGNCGIIHSIPAY